MKTEPLTVDAIVNSTYVASALIDSGCLTYSLVNRSFAKRSKLQRHKISPIFIEGIEGKLMSVDEVVKFTFDLNGHREECFGYVVDKAMNEDFILGLSWMYRNDARIAPAKKSIYLKRWGTRIHTHQGTSSRLDIVEIGAVAFQQQIKKARSQKNEVQVFAASLADINKALAPKIKADTSKLLPEQYQWAKDLFDPKEASQLPPHRNGMDHAIELNEGKDGKKPEAPWGPLYNMSKGELLVLRKELTSLLDKGFIRASSSPAASPVLFAKKPGGGLRLCIDYRALNALTRKDRYPLPLIQETLNNVAKAKWFTKLDVIAAFHKIRIREGDEWLTAFRTRFGLYEWLVTPFGMANSPSTFQRYINWALREFLDDFCSAYLDDVLIYTDGSLQQHREHVNKVLKKLRDAGLFVDINKCEFEVKSTKYLGFIIEAGKGILMDPQKVKAIKEWEAPTTVKGIRSFLGFANFYRKFIKNFASIAAPLTRLTGNVPFRWTKEEEEAFEYLKNAFITEPVLAQFDPDLETVLETDSSGYATGAVLSQFGKDGILRPCAYFSRKSSAHECNYEIHDKELLAVIRALEEWDAELRSVKSFRVITDHKNLEYFMKPRMLNERQMRWSLLLGRYNMEILYRPGKQNIRADVLSRREQDMPRNDQDDRLQHRLIQVLKPSTAYYEEEEKSEDLKEELVLAGSIQIRALPAATQEPMEIQPNELETLWEESRESDAVYQGAVEALKKNERRFPIALRLKCSIAECRLEGETLYYRNRKWVPDSEPLRTRIIEQSHSSLATGHPGRQITYQIVARDFFWPGMSDAIRRFIRNCDTCGRTKPWKEGLQGLLKPLPVPERIWKEVSMDFITELPESNGCTNLMVVTDRLSKDPVFVPIPDLKTDTVVQAYFTHVLAYHWIPDAIVTDRGPQFLSLFWERLCQLLRIKRRLSTAFHPQTDGSTERMNSVWEAYMRAFVNWAQQDWATLCPMAQIAIKGRDATSTGVSPFFLQHGYNVEPIQLEIESPRQQESKTGVEKAQSIVAKMKGVFELAQASMAEAQQEQEKQANRHRREARQLRVGDKVWLKLGQQFSTGRTSRKLDWKSAKYTVTEVIGTHNVRLNIPPGPHNVFHMDRLRLAGTDPLPSQQRDDDQPPPIQVDGQDEYEVEAILAETYRRVGRGREHLWYEVKWTGYALTTWEPRENLEETQQLDDWESYSAPFRANGRLPPGFRRGTEHDSHPDLTPVPERGAIVMG